MYAPSLCFQSTSITPGLSTYIVCSLLIDLFIHLPNILDREIKQVRDDCAREFAKWPEVLAFLDVGNRPKKMTTRAAIKSARNVLNGHPAKEESYKTISGLNLTFGYEFDSVRRVNNDLAHGIWNCIKNVIAIITGTGESMKWKPSRAATEQAHGRFIGVANGTTK